MKFSTLGLTALGMGLGLSIAQAGAPGFLVTHNHTPVQSNAFIDGTIASPYPTEANADGKLLWTLVRMACNGHIHNGRCSAVIKMATNTTKPVTLGTVSMDMETGDISPKFISGNGYTLTVNGPGESTLNVE